MSGTLNISATEDTVESVLARNYRFEVPDYQRRYSWTEEQLRAFWSDLVALEENESHFLGSIVVIQRSSSLDELNTLELVDGQQRLATISVLLAIMRECYREENEESEHADAIDEDYIWEYDLDRNRFQNLKLGTFDNDEFHSILVGRWSELQDGQLREACKFFANQLDNLNIDEIDTIRKRLLNSMTLVTIDCNSELSAFKLFETLNERGLPLSAVDLMKNYLFQVATQRTEVNYENVKDRWETILKNIMPESNKPDRFFRHYIMSSPAPDINQDVSSYKLFDIFRDIIENRLPEESIGVDEYVEDMAAKSGLYVEIAQASVDRFENEGAQKEINKKLRDLNAIKSIQARTILLRIFTEFNNPNTILEALDLLEVFMLRWKVANYPTGGELDRVYADICSEVFVLPNPISSLKNYFSNRVPTDDQFRTGITDKNVRTNDRTKYILDTIERKHYMKSGEGKEISDRSAVDIEHIAPRNAFTAKKYNTWRSYLDVNEEVFDDHCNMLGNLTLLENKENRSAGDDPFNQKKERYANSDFEMTRVLCTCDEWSIEKIQSRTRELAKIATHIWSFDNE